MNDLQRQKVREVNEQYLNDTATRVVEVMKVSHGVMKAPTVEQVRNDLANAFEALKRVPEGDQTYGQVSLLRMATDSSVYYVRLNLGTITHLSED